MENKNIEVLWEVLDKQRSNSEQKSYFYFSCLYLSQKLKKMDIEELIENFDDEIMKKILQNLYDENQDLIKHFKQISIESQNEWLEVFNRLSLNNQMKGFTTNVPISVIKLIDNFLELNNNDSLLNVCSGIGSALAYLSINKDIKISAIEKNLMNYVQSNLLLDVLNKKDANIQLGNILKTNINSFEANKILINVPMGQRLSSETRNEVIEEKIANTSFEELIKSYDGAWLYILDVLLNTEFEKVVAIVNQAPLVNNRDILIRKQLMKEGLIEAVIDLPRGIIDYTNIPVSLIVFSKNNKDVKFIDASKLGAKKQNQTILVQNDIEKIIQSLKIDGEISKTCRFEEIEKEEFVLSAKRYLISDLPFEHTISLKEVVKFINRGTMIPKANLKNIVAKEPTNYQYLTLKDFEHGLVSNDLIFLKEIDKSLERYVIKEHSLIISKMSPFKVASIDPKDNKIVVNGNLYFIEIDKNKINSKYLEAFLQSKLGMRELQKYKKGSAMQTISIRDLEKVRIPLLSLEEQEKISREFELLNRELKVALENIQRIEKQKNTIMEVR